MSSKRLPPSLPKKLVVGYGSWGECDEKVIDAVKQGVNVLIWFSINLAVDDTGKPMISINGLEMECVQEKIRFIKEELGLTDTVHLISIGGWNAPHPDTTNSAETVFEVFDNWNKVHGQSFDGIDWDIEGNDTPSSPFNHFSVDCLNLMGRFSQLAKSKGYIVSMAPAESYLDPSTHLFDRSLLHTYPEWDDIIKPPFAYHGRNCYAYLLSRFEKTDEGMDTFDFVTVQLYEGYSHALYNISIDKSQSAPEYLVSFVKKMEEGWEVDFAADNELQWPKSHVKVPREKLVIGLANGWAGDGKFLLIPPDDVGRAFEILEKDGCSVDHHDTCWSPRGAAFWCIQEEGKISSQIPDTPIWMAAGLNSFLQTRK